jgi:hypothetical protein
VLGGLAELVKLANGVLRQLGFQELEFEVVLVDSMYDGNPLLIETMRATLHSIVPGAKPVRLTVPPVSFYSIFGKSSQAFSQCIQCSLRTISEM